MVSDTFAIWQRRNVGNVKNVKVVDATGFHDHTNFIWPKRRFHEFESVEDDVSRSLRYRDIDVRFWDMTVEEEAFYQMFDRAMTRRKKDKVLMDAWLRYISEEFFNEYV